MKNLLALVGLFVILAWIFGYFGSFSLSDLLYTIGSIIIDLSNTLDLQSMEIYYE